MSFWNPEQYAAAQRANLETSFALANHAFAHVQKVVELNLDTFKSAVGESQEAVLHAASSKSPREWFALRANPLEQAVARTQTYYSRLFSIATAAQTEFANVANEQYAEHQRRLHHFVDDAGRHVPAASEPAITALKSAINTVSAWYESTRKATQQAIDAAETNVEAVNAAVSKTTKRAAEPAERAAAK
ncbi:phasin family protein [Trinickia violacea]|uniref:Phasin family protein n=1 Tax=Trinickia violacea TaxID=2571746 RepID=A0A4P8J1A0_9BURK|nr:phasin family protein [Trinickia violacea]QCP53723.1 phasin family protein [Trinickia violacea]